MASMQGPGPRGGDNLKLRASRAVYGQPWTFEYRALAGFTSPSGDKAPAIIAATGVLISLLLFSVVRILASTREQAEIMARDMTRQLRESENLFRGLWETTTDAVVLTDNLGRILYANSALHEVFGHEPADVIGKDIAVLQPATLRAAHRAGMARYLQTGSKTLDWRSFETRGLHRRGSEFPIEISFSRMDIDARPGFAGFIRDISARKQIEEALRESEEKYRRLVDLSPDLVTVHQDGIFVFANAAAAKLLGLESPTQLINRSIIEFVHPDSHHVLTARMKLLYEGGHPTEPGELKLRRSDAGVVHLETHAVPIVWQGRPAAQVVARDITGRKRAEEALAEYSQRLQAMSRQLLEVQENERRSLARELHDTVGQELTAISLNLAMLRDALPEDLAQRVGDRLEDSEKLLEATSGRLRNIMADLRPPGIDELGFMTVLKEHARAVAQRSELKLTIEGADARQRFAPATAIALFRIAQEALNNSVKHAHASVIGVKLQDEPDVVRLTLYDNGRGFDAGRTRAFGAYGMGMTTMRERAEAIGARLHIEAAPGQGTRISVVVPRAAVAAQDKDESRGTDA
jgi:PAS domain S-box-containing protein